MYRRHGFWGGPFMGGPYMRRRGFPLLPMGGFGWGGMGMGMGGGYGSSLLGDLAAGGIGYLLGSRSSQQQAQQYQAPQYQPQYQAPPQQYQAPQYQAPQYQAPQYQAPAGQGTNEQLAQLRLLGHLRQSNLLTDDEFEREKQQILNG